MFTETTVFTFHAVVFNIYFNLFLLFSHCWWTLFHLTRQQLSMWATHSVVHVEQSAAGISEDCTGWKPVFCRQIHAQTNMTALLWMKREAFPSQLRDSFFLLVSWNTSTASHRCGGVTALHWAPHPLAKAKPRRPVEETLGLSIGIS